MRAGFYFILAGTAVWTTTLGISVAHNIYPAFSLFYLIGGALMGAGLMAYQVEISRLQEKIKTLKAKRRAWQWKKAHAMLRLQLIKSGVKIR